MKITKITGVFAILSLALAANSYGALPSEAQTTQGTWKSAYLGAMPGIGFVSNGGGGNFSMGLDAGVRVTDLLGVGLYFNHTSYGVGSNVSVPTGSTIENGSANTVAGEANYFFRDQLDGLHVGGKAGLKSASQAVITPAGQVPVVADNSNAFVFGPHIAYDYKIAPQATIGGEFNVLFTTASGGTTDTNVLAAIKWWP